jgi:hypothetical protein
VPAPALGNDPRTEGTTMNNIALTEEQEPIGIIIQDGGERRQPAAIWAYMWAADEDDATDHWHQHMPVDHAA